ncbi:glucosamine-6-phosphate deaminase [Mycoplasmopsis cynos]|uniref:glucosamine-6-phosphate deaminase n=1 Tax=Mycoplasmopsis cynos TaxID=171284 RepID=UPI002AFE6446|nr:glucosamine-6-phosphate deaminase [Mycoplasmopsis cynos]WQQ17874.1 glucosamine-6-phosphate deaminase [Mycoplasmopsis cynos]WQQ19271.1 glucosamine-6-phosphate deaminase [Mycoplasmopsis cynos]
MKIYIKLDTQRQSDFAANIIKEEMLKKPNLNICFATGNSPIKTYKKLIEMHQNKEISFKNVTSFNLDEYVGISPENKCSYHYFMQKELFSHIDIKKENINLPNGIGNITKNAADYEKIIKEKGGIDLMILGIGTNAHIAFNEPGSLDTETTREVKLTQSTINSNKIYFNNEEDVPKTAISMGIKSILSAKKIILLADGKNKAKAIYDTIFAKIGPNVPSSYLRNHPDVSLILDNDAAELIKLKNNH